MLKVLDNDRGDNEATADEDAAPTLDELARTGARKMLMTALAVEVAQYVDAHQEARDEQGRRLVVRNGRARARKVTCGAGTLEVSAPRVHDKRVDAAGQPQRFTSRIRGARGQVPEGGGVPGCGPGPPPHALCPPGRALATRADEQRDRIAVCHGPAPTARDQRRGLTHQGSVDGLQAARDGPAAVASSQRRAPAPTRPRWRDIHRWCATGTK